MVNSDGMEFTERTPILTWEKAINDKVKLFLNNDDNINLCKSIKLKPTHEGVIIRAELIEQAGELYNKIKAGLLCSFSFGFKCLKDSWEVINGLAHRTLEDIELFDGSILCGTIPAYNGTRLNIRSLCIPKDIMYEQIEKEFELMKLELELIKLK